MTEFKFNFDAFQQNFQAQFASNNWRRMHGYPLRRKVVNAQYKDAKKHKKLLAQGGSGAGISRYNTKPYVLRARQTLEE